MGNGNTAHRAALGALKFIDGTLPRLIRHPANMRLRRTPARLNTVHRACVVRVLTCGWKSSEERCRIVLRELRSLTRPNLLDDLRMTPNRDRHRNS